jgi:protein-S-isoprenylcysteine O-methyltransferase Ste14
MDVPLIVAATTVWTYWLSVVGMVVRSHLRYRTSAGGLPRAIRERVMWVVWVPAIVLWQVVPYLASVSSHPLLALPPLVRGNPLAAASRWAGAAFAVSAFLLTIPCWLGMGRCWSMAIVPKKRTRLITEGMFAHVRHPIYALSILLMLGTVLVVPSAAMIGVAAVHVVMIYLKTVSEERYLRETHGAKYTEYCRRTGRFLPRIRLSVLVPRLRLGTHQRVETGSRAKPWHPRLWHGMTLPAWFSLLARNRFAIAPSRFPMAAAISLASVVNSLLAVAQQLIFGRKIRRTRVEESPIFIIGHWRTGTTLLHELLALDRRHACPTTYACLAPRHFLVSRCLVTWWLGLLMPKRRPMDNMRVGWDRPQEDEWALCTMGVPTPYAAVAFPRRLPHHPEHADLKGLGPKARRRWKRDFLWFLRCVSVASPKRLVLKSPLSTSRIEILLEMFPRARFVHVVRDPYSVYPSTVRLWTRLAADHGLQGLPAEGFEEFVLAGLESMYRSFESARHALDPRRLCEVRYEDLVADPVGQMQRIYEELDLGGFDQVRPGIEKYCDENREYQPNRHQLSPAEQEKVSRRWREFIERYDYSPGTTPQAESAQPRRKIA